MDLVTFLRLYLFHRMQLGCHQAPNPMQTLHQHDPVALALASYLSHSTLKMSNGSILRFEVIKNKINKLKVERIGC